MDSNIIFLSGMVLLGGLNACIELSIKTSLVLHFFTSTQSCDQ